MTSPSPFCSQLEIFVCLSIKDRCRTEKISYLFLNSLPKYKCILSRGNIYMQNCRAMVEYNCAVGLSLERTMTVTESMDRRKRVQ